jgi:(p)ppGpp synthase/HD superfamily hydrolase
MNSHEYLEHMDQQLFLAEQVATKAHEGQTRWDGTPYIAHPARVAKWLRDQGYSHIYQIVGWLHDTVEDTGLLYEEIEDKFDPEVKKAVQCLTHDDESYADYIMRIRTNEIATAVKIADLNDNLSDLLPKQKQRIDKYELALAILEEANG